MTEKQFYKLHHKQIYKPGHPYAYKGGCVLEYRFEVEKVIGRFLTTKEEVHHQYNADGSTDLVLCPSRRYHKLLHTCEEALRECGHSDWRKCIFCKQYDDPQNLSINSGVYHKSCRNKYQRERKSNLIKYYREKE